MTSEASPAPPPPACKGTPPPHARGESPPACNCLIEASSLARSLCAARSCLRRAWHWQRALKCISRAAAQAAPRWRVPCLRVTKPAPRRPRQPRLQPPAGCAHARWPLAAPTISLACAPAPLPLALARCSNCMVYGVAQPSGVTQVARLASARLLPQLARSSVPACACARLHMVAWRRAGAHGCMPWVKAARYWPGCDDHARSLVEGPRVPRSTDRVTGQSSARHRSK